MATEEITDDDVIDVIETPPPATGTQGETAVIELLEISDDASGALDQIFNLNDEFNTLQDEYKQARTAIQDERKAFEASLPERKKLVESLKVPEIPDAPKFDPRTEWEAFGSIGTVVGMLGSLFSRRPVMSAMRSAGEVLDAARDGDIEMYELAYKSWRDNANLAVKQSEAENARISAILNDETKTWDQRLNLVKADYEALGNRSGLMQAQSGNVARVLDFETKRLDAIAKLRELNNKLTAPINNFHFRGKLVERYGEGSPQVRRFDNYVRQNDWQDIGGSKFLPDIGNPGQPAAEIQKTVPPQDTPGVRGAQAGAVSQAQLDVEKKDKMPKARATLDAMDAQNNLVDESVDRALAKSNGWTTGLMGALSNQIPGTDAFDLAQTLLTIKANIGFDKLQDMRNQSPTGGALGQVSDFENRNLQAVMGALEQAQSKEEFDFNLKRLKVIMKESRERREKAFDADFKGVAPARRAEPTAKYTEGTIIRNQKTNERRIMRNGKWEKL